VARVTIDREECIQCATCWEDCPEVFEESEEDYLSQIVEQYRVDGDPAVGEIPDELESAAQEAADLCPVEVIHVEAA
jgi:ferredoxin